ncbi:hypothetical protein BK133_03080 [Paenibacillus sp. FSL H8-0548]|uniref:chondroitinase-B domain-containing protein n=1 Tax=Paenibacillus sp. FSL H8-0548 TaxID=1920422 RepID=UPI00096F213D|nr:chondroitinase-B domain-containing protein [Paenibacillus sp. FSL H8-0548]OMF37983.1 hypothetical protein BK133_03080 [Paenibacillus sp. FSL H8-0548]
MFKRARGRSLSKSVHIGLSLLLVLSVLPLMSQPLQIAQASPAETGTPGGVNKNVKLWLNADSGNVTAAENQEISRWEDSSGNGNHFINDGTITNIADRPKPQYITSHEGLNYQPAVQFVRSGGSILQDSDGIFSNMEEVDSANVFLVSGGTPSIANSSVFSESLTSGSFNAHIPHTSGSTLGKGTVFWDAGTMPSGTGIPRAQAVNQVLPSEYNLWGLHFEANPTISQSVYQSIYRDGTAVLQSTSPRLPIIGKSNGEMSLGSAAAGGSGYNGLVSELIVYASALTEIERRQVDSYLAIKYGLALESGSYLSAGNAPLSVWDSTINAGFTNNVAGIATDQEGALSLAQSRSSKGVPGEQIIVTAAEPLSDKQYLMWGDNGDTGPRIPYGNGYLRLARTWKAQNTNSTGQVQIAVPQSMVPLGGVLITSNDSSFANGSTAILSPITLHGNSYYAATISLADGLYFTFAEMLPETQLSSLEIWNGGVQIPMNKTFDPNETSGYSAIVTHDTSSIRLNSTTSSPASVAIKLSNYENINTVIADAANIPLLPGVNRLSIQLDNGNGAMNQYSLEVIRSLVIEPSGKLILHAGSVAASSFQPNTSFAPTNLVDGIWGEDEAAMESRWSASGSGQWVQFDLGQPQTITYVQIAFLNARERNSSFELLASNDSSFTQSTVVMKKRDSRLLQSNDSIMQPYVAEQPVAARYFRLVGYGNNASGSSGNWNSMMEMELYIGTPPEIDEPDEPGGPPQAGDNDEDDFPLPDMTHVSVNTAVELQQALDQAAPGMIIELQNGQYEQAGPFVILNKHGSAALPIKITAAEIGGAVITGDSYFHIEGSSYIEVSGLTFNNGIGSAAGAQSLNDRGLGSRVLTGVHPGVQLYSSSYTSIMRNTFALNDTGQPYQFTSNEGNVWCLIGIDGSCRISGSEYNPEAPVYTGDTPYTNDSLLITNGTHRHFIRVEGVSSHNRISYNEIGPKRGFGAVVIYDGAGHSGESISQYDIIEYNYFHSIGPRVSNGLEAIRLGLSSLSLNSGFVTIQHNLFDGLDGEDEIISVKSSDNIVRYNTILNSYGGIVSRHGNRNSFYGNFIIGDGITPGRSGFRIYGNGHKIYNNYMEALTDRIIRLDGGTHDDSGDGGTNPIVRWGGASEQSARLNDLPVAERTELLRGHWRQYNVEIYHNTIVNVGNGTTGIALGGRTYQPVGTKIYNNIVFSNAGNIFNETNAVMGMSPNERPQYAGNIVDGIAAVSNNALVTNAVRHEALKLIRSNDGLIRLSALSPAVDAAVAPHYAWEDIDGQPRYIPDAGADEYNPGLRVMNRPLTAADVGPQASTTPPVVIEKTGLSSITIHSSAALQPSFDSDTAYYTMTLPAEISSLSITPTAVSATAQITVSVDGSQPKPVISGQPSEQLTIAQNGSVITIQVSVPISGSKLYTIMVKRPVSTGGGSGNPGGSIPTLPDSGESAEEEETASHLNDISKHWAEAAIIKAAALGISSGFPDGAFKPDEPITRAQFAVFLVRALGLEPTASAVKFADQQDIPSWAAEQLLTAVEAGILKGYEDQTLRPHAKISRAEMAVMMMRAYPADTASNPTPNFSDTADIPSWALEAVGILQELKLFVGRNHNSFAPNETATRAEAITVLIRLLELQ